VNWRQKIDQQRGAVFATELKSNSYKLAKWTAQSIIAKADYMKLGYISRIALTNPNDGDSDHSILQTSRACLAIESKFE
jgi:translation initiation factor 3 subunit D